MLRWLVPVLLVVLQPLAALAEEETVEQILAKHYAARGGLDKIKAVDGVKMSAVLQMQGMEAPATILVKRPHYFRSELEIPGMEMLQAYDGEVAWGTNPMTGITDPQPFTGFEADQVKRQADFEGFLVEPVRKGHSVELVGKESLGEGEAYRLKVTLADGGVIEVLIGADDYLEHRHFMELEMMGSSIGAEIELSDYREVDGILFPFRRVTKTDMGEFTMVLSDVETGLDIEDDLFYLPGQEANPELTLEDVLSRHRSARVKAGNESVESLKATGRVKFQGFELPMTMFFERPSAFRVDINLQGLEMVQAYDGAVAWTISPMQGITEPQALGPEARDAVAIFSDFVWGLLTKSEKPEGEIELAGIEKVERDETYLLKVALDGGLERQVYIGGEDFLERQLSFSTVFMGASGQLDARLSDYVTVEGLVLPKRIELLMGGAAQGEMTIDEVEVNASLEGVEFGMPEPAPPEATTPPSGEGEGR